MLDRIEKLCIDVATAAIILLALMIFADVIALNLFHASVPDAVIIVRELMVLAIIMPLAAATTQRAHIAVEFLTNMLPPRLVDCFVVFGTFFGVFALTPLIYAGGKELMHQINTGSAFYGDLNLPQWPGRLAFVTGIALCWLRLLMMGCSDIVTLWRGGRLALDAAGD
ncbi:TRAP transporter small permease [Pseudophaeobacter flagellatus]|uniref:TRAP transporter small permease n=1 Tax=Pseudophaeobacter flagellatus TaxID=2899119 RepID=UPI001E63DC17|nr:TRAP transporter small permease [Pseudophaeobacter flagellatus]MCD9149698.1 TRAP transporter small permease [Pseudophaeobacter flagellatus]